MKPMKLAAWVSLTLAGITPVVLLATAEGLPVARTGSFGEPGCDGFGCHRVEPLPAVLARLSIDVGPYVPLQRQQVVVTITDINASRWGFQLAARERRNPQRQAGTFFPTPDPPAFVQMRCADGTRGPCGGMLEYVTHTSVGTRAGLRAGFVKYLVDWTAPASDVGEVIFTAAAVGADNDLGTNGDRTASTTAISLFAASNQPGVREGGAVSAASFLAPNGAIGHGSLVTLFGDKLAPPGFSREVTRSDLVGDRLPTELNRTGADFILPPGVNYPAYVLFVNERQINVQVPEVPAAFTGRVEVQPVFNRGQGTNEVRGNRVAVSLQPRSPALFTFADGRSAAAVHVPVRALVGRTGQFPNSRPARPGDVIEVYGTGFGQTNPRIEAGALADGPATLVNAVTARIGGVGLASGDILYAGAAPAFAGLQQFNLRVPAGVSSGDQPIVLSVGGLDTQANVILRVEP